MERQRLHELLRARAHCLRLSDEVVERALARGARLEVRSKLAGMSTRATSPVSVVPPPPPPPPPPATAEGATVPSLNQSIDAPAGPPGPLLPGRIIAGYRIESLLGKGGMGSVYRATQLSMARPIAFKVLAPRLAGDPTFVGRFKREARAAGRLHHPNLITVHEAGEANGLVYFSMELVEGRSLREVLKDQDRIPPAQAISVARQTLEALRFAHEKGVVHRDIKPDNIMLTAAGQVKLADLGLSRIDSQASGETTEMFKTAADSFMGTPHYMAPEQGRDAHSADARADLYSLGATLFHLVCGRAPFEGSTPMAVMVAAQGQPLVFPDPGPPKPLRDFIVKLMEKKPEKRPADAAAALALLDRLTTVKAKAAPRPWWRRLLSAMPWILGLAVAIGMVLIVMRIGRERVRDSDWQQTLAAVEQDTSERRWNEALDRLSAARADMGAGARRDACDEESARVMAAWDAWALANLADTERRFRELLKARSFAEALDLLKQVPPNRRSPAAEARLDELRTELEEKAIIDKPPRPKDEAWPNAGINPSSAGRMEDGQEILSASGTARLPLPAADRPGMQLLSLRLSWRGHSDANATWSADLGGGAKVAVTPTTATVTIGSRTLALAGTVSGGQAMHLVRRGGSLMVLTRDAAGVITPVPLPGAAAELTMRWELGTAELGVALSSRKPPR